MATPPKVLPQYATERIGQNGYRPRLRFAQNRGGSAQHVEGATPERFQNRDERTHPPRRGVETPSPVKPPNGGITGPGATGVIWQWLRAPYTRWEVARKQKAQREELHRQDAQAQLREKERLRWAEQQRKAREENARLREWNTVAALDPWEFERYVARLFKAQQWSVKMTPVSNDHGVDLRVQDASGKRFVVQCKHYVNACVGRPDVQRFYGVVVHENADGYFITSGRFSEGAKNFAKGKNIRMIDGQELMAWAARAFADSQSV